MSTSEGGKSGTSGENESQNTTPPRLTRRAERNPVVSVDYSSGFRLADCLQQQTQKERPSLTVERIEPPGSGNFDKVAAIVDGSLSPSECRTLIDRAETAGFRPALLNVGGGREIFDPQSRNSDRCIIDDEMFAKGMFERLRDHLPNKWEDRYGDRWKAVGLNERIRILRYSPGHSFACHRDGRYVRGAEAESREGETSFCTLMIYLNSGNGDDFEGGSTLFLPDYSRSAKKAESCIEVVPREGRVLVFDHTLLHEGGLVKSGVKYAMRTDLMFEKDPTPPMEY